MHRCESERDGAVRSTGAVDWHVWEICENPTYEVLAHRATPKQIDRHNVNSRAHSVLFLSFSLTEFERVSHLATAREI